MKKKALYVIIIINIQLCIIMYNTFQKGKYTFQQFIGFYTKYIVVGCIFLDICMLMNSNWTISTYSPYKYSVEGENMKLLDQDLLSACVTLNNLKKKAIKIWLLKKKSLENKILNIFYLVLLEYL